jgi:replicative DNA helicase
MMPQSPSGVGTLDKAVRLRGPQLVILAARPAMGKSALALQYAIATARTGRAVLFVSQEMRPAELVSRALLASAGLRAEDVERGVDAKQHAALLAVAETLTTLPIAFTRALDVSADDVAAEALRQHARAPLGLVVIDYLTLLRKPKADREDLAVGAMTRRLKLLAMELGCPVLVLAQLNRECEKRPDKRPHLSDLRQSGDVEQDADVVLFVYRDEVYKPDTKDPGIGEIIARKVRAGSPGTVRLGWDGPATRFYDLEPAASSPPAREDARWAPPVEDDDAQPQDEVPW